MKIKYSIIFLGIILLSLFSCSDSKLGQETDLKKYHLKGDVIFVSENDGKSFKLFNEFGMETRRFCGEERDNWFWDINSFFDKNKIKNTIDESVYNGLTNKSVYEYTYNSNDNLEQLLLKDISNGSNIFTEKYKYDLNGNLINKINDGSISHSEEIFFYSNKLDSSINIVKYQKDITTYINYFNNEDNRIRSQEYSDNRKLLRVNDYKYNENNDVSEEIYTDYSTNENNPTITKTTYEYNYDKKGNWIQRRGVNSDGSTEITNRTIIYKGEDISSFIKKSDEIISSVKNKTTNENNTESSDNNSQTESNNNSSSNTYQKPQRQQQPEKVNCYSCRGSGNCGECGKIFRVHTWEGNGWKDRNETRLGYVMCSDCRGAGVSYKRSDYPNAGKWEIEKKCYVGNCNSGWKPCNKCNGYGNGTLLGKCRDCKGSGFRN